MDAAHSSGDESMTMVAHRIDARRPGADGPLGPGVERVHLVGIGGAGMEGLARLLDAMGYRITGSDVSEGPVIEDLRRSGIAVFHGHDAAHTRAADLLIHSAAIPESNPERQAASSAGIRQLRRASALGLLSRGYDTVAVAGTHGKTTTTSLVAAILDAAEMDPTVINGGIINAWGSNARLGAGEWLVAEADESDGTFLKLPATIAVVTNIDPEHLDHYGSFDNLREAFEGFIENLPFYGFAALCIDHAEVQAMIPRVSDRRIVTYGFSPQAEVRGVGLEANANGTRFDAVIAKHKLGSERVMEGLYLPMLGKHNVENALAAISIAVEMNIDDRTHNLGNGAVCVCSGHGLAPVALEFSYLVTFCFSSRQPA